jgi:hypothetical protein
MASFQNDVRINILNIIAGSLGFTMSLALNTALKDTFDLIPISMKNKVANDWLYVFIVSGVVLLALWGIFELKRLQLNKDKADTAKEAADLASAKAAAVVES